MDSGHGVLDLLLLVHVNCTAEYENQEALEVNRTHLLPVSVEDVNLFGNNLNNRKKKLLVVIKKVGSEIKPETTKCMCMSHYRMQREIIM
jgi:hypothetical protein